MSEGMREFTDANFATDALGSPLPVVVDFWAEWCGPCKMLTPILSKIASDLEGKVTVGKLNVDQNPQTATRYTVNSIPTLLFIKDGRVREQHTGLLAEKPLSEKIKKTFGL
ncbi:MAG: thioredoxin [Chitinispirillaceae bacterium]|nr:thioredoxin [Chitinispirillaceae bacterium]